MEREKTVEEIDMECMAERIKDHLLQADEREYQAARAKLANERLIYVNGDWCWE